MELNVDVLSVELKDLEQFNLHCKVEGSGEQITETSMVDIRGSTRELNQQSELPKFKFNFKKPSPNLALLFTVTSIGGAFSVPAELGQCLFPVTFHSTTALKDLGPLDLAAADVKNKAHLAIITRQLEGTAVTKALGKVWFKVNSKKPVPRPKLKAHMSMLDLKIVKERLTVPVKTGPVVSDLVFRENEAACVESMPVDKPTVIVLSHFVRTTQEHLSSDLHPIACVSHTLSDRIDELFKESDSKETTIVPTQKTVTLKCKDSEEFLDLHVANNRVIFLASHQIQSLVPFKHYNWEYNWRWTTGSSGFSPSLSQNAHEPCAMISLVHRPAASDYNKYEGLEFLIHSVDVVESLEDRNIVVCTEVVDSKRGESKLTDRAKATPFVKDKDSHDSDNFNILMMKYKDHGGSTKTVPAYFFFTTDSHFHSRRTDRKLVVNLYVTDDLNNRLWWETDAVASATINLPRGMQRVLLNQENQTGVYWELSREAVTQSRSVTSRISGVMRWKGKEMGFMTPNIVNRLEDLPALDDLIFSVPDTEVTSLSGSPPPLPLNPVLLGTIAGGRHDTHIAPDPSVTEVEYRRALDKMGSDIMKLRQENKTLKEEKTQLEKHIIDHESSIIVTAGDQRKLHPLSKADLIHKVVELSEHLSLEVDTRQSYRKKVRELQNKLIERNDLEDKYIQIQEAHTAQQKLVRELQAKIEKYRKCYHTSRQQETVIEQYESLLAHQNRDHRSEDTRLSALSKENARLRAALREYQDGELDERKSPLSEKNETILSLTSELTKFKARCRHLEERMHPGASERAGVEVGVLYDQTSRLHEVEKKLNLAKAREKTLMRELEENAKKRIQEKAEYELKLAEYKSGGERLMTSEHDTSLPHRDHTHRHQHQHRDDVLRQSSPSSFHHSNTRLSRTRDSLESRHVNF